ncbi:hypothetical protein [Arthrobacter sp. BF1]|uniref:hypothetical protein n=1 Tax=Arthrobacter sp. BF1 TaxID=2821145 RepID=UPI001C500263|nr:hypothetical protein [Arthrobacter sp. BF1]
MANTPNYNLPLITPQDPARLYAQRHNEVANAMDAALVANIADLMGETTATVASFVHRGEGVILGTNGKKYRIIACTVRNTGSGFQFISDSSHSPIGVASLTTQSETFTLNYSFTAKSVGTLIVTGDEKLSSDGYIFGASVGLTSSVIYGSLPGGASDYVSYNGSAWTSFNGYVTNTSMNTSTGLVTCTHEAMNPEVGGSITSRSLSRHGVLDGMGPTTTSFYFVDSAGTPDKTPRTEHKMWINRAGSRTAKMNTLTKPNTNIWIYGVMEIA